MPRPPLLPAATVILALLLALPGCWRSDPGGVEVIVVGTQPTFPPFESRDDTGALVGFDIDLFRAIARDQNLEHRFEDQTFDALIPSLDSGAIDVAVSGMSITPERRLAVDFTDAYVNAGLVLAVPTDAQIAGVDDLAGRSVGVNIGTTGAFVAEALAADGKVGAVKTFEDTGLSMEALAAGKVDAVINDKPVVQFYARNRPGTVEVLPTVLQADDYGMAVRKGNAELLAKLNAGLASVRDSGEYAEIEEKWFGGGEEAAAE